MHHRTITLVVALFAVIVAGMFGFAYLKNQELELAAEKQAQMNSPSVVAKKFSYLEQIEATTQFADGVHTISGTLLLPTPCDELSVEAIVAESYPEQVTLQFSVGGVSDFCAQVMTEQPFSIVVTVSQNASFKATLQGQPIPLTFSS